MEFRPGAVEGLVSAAFANFYEGKRVLVTGHTGFKGAWLSLWLRNLGAAVTGVSLPAPTQPNLHEVVRAAAFAAEHECDIRDGGRLASLVAAIKPDVVFHLAAQAIVRQSYAEPLETFATNATGTAHLLEAVRCASLPCMVIVVTSDKCYENQGWDHGYRETDPLGGHDPYSMSKAAAELVAASWRRSFFLPDARLGHLVTVRAGNVIGGGDYAADRIVPDCVRSLLAGRAIAVRNPAATRPWQHVLDCLSGYLWLGVRLANVEKTSPLVGAFNFGPGLQANVPVRELVEELLRQWPGTWEHTPAPGAPKEAARLNLAIDKAAALLGWHPTWEFRDAVRATAQWYHERHVAKRADMTAFTLVQIAAFTDAARRKGLAWAVS